MQIVYMGTFPPRECGIATFTADLVGSFDDLFRPREETKVIAMDAEGSPDYAYPGKVFMQIAENDPEQYAAAARKLNASPEVKLVSVQHEFGIFGRNDGENIIVFLKELKKPVTVTCHTVLPNPSENIKRIMCEISEHAGRLIVMTQTSKQLLESIYGISPDKIRVVPHGIHPRPYSSSEKMKAALGFSDRRVLSTFGLLNRGKGIEHGIAALPAIIKKFPNVLYAVIGTTHPVVMRREGPVYLNELRELVKKLGLEDRVIFFDRFMETPELLDVLQATDIYLSLSQNPDQAVSGTLTYALGTGRPVVSTPFAQAKEFVTPELGILAEFNDSKSIADAVISLFEDQGRLMSMSKAAYFRTRSMTWPNVALSYMREFKKLSPELAQKEKSLPPVRLDHLKRMTDDFGMMQFAILTDPDPESGYTIDDNARAMIAACWFSSMTGIQGAPDISEFHSLISIYIGFLERAAEVDVSRAEGGSVPDFQNYFNKERMPDSKRNMNENLEDADARAAWSLSVLAAADCVPEPLRARAEALLLKHHGNVRAEEITSPRAMAFRIKSLAEWIRIPKTLMPRRIS